MEKNKLTYLIKKFSKRFYVVINEQNLHLKPTLESLLYEILVTSFKKELPVVAE